VERFFAHGFGRGVPASAGGGGFVHALTLALDYRSDALAVWAQGGEIYAHDLPASGDVHTIERLAPVGPYPRISALLSDDNRAIVAWADERGGETSVYIDRSATGVRFGAPMLLERFRDPDGLSSPAGSPRLVRLSSESVMMAWAGSADGHWVVHTAAVDLDGVGAVSIFAARGIDTYPRRTLFGKPEEVAPPAPNADATVAFDPDSDRALAVWRGEGAIVEYAIRDPISSP
jgi:hypothetical protein